MEAFERRGSGLFLEREGFFTSTTVGEQRSHPLVAVRRGRLSAHRFTQLTPAPWISIPRARDGVRERPTRYVRSLRDWDIAAPAPWNTRRCVQSARFSPDGDSLATRRRAGEIRVWPVDGNGRAASKSSTPRAPAAFAYSPRGRWLAGLCAGRGRPFVRPSLGLKAPRGADAPRLMSDDRRS